jgi:hypothetical protein
LGARLVRTNIKAPDNKVIKVAWEKTVVAPSSAIIEVNQQVDIKPLKTIIAMPKMCMIVRKTFMEVLRVYATLTWQITKICKDIIDR